MNGVRHSRRNGSADGRFRRMEVRSIGRRTPSLGHSLTSASLPGTTRALLLESVHRDAVELLEAAGVTVETASGALDQAELEARLAGVQLLGIRSKTEISASVVSGAPDLLAIGAFCIGT